MNNKKLLIGIAAGAALLAGAAVLISRKRAGKQYAADIQDAKEHFRGKLNELQRRAQKHYKNNGPDVKEVVNTAKDRANEWVNKVKV
jgi:gas vesicle protein